MTGVPSPLRKASWLVASSSQYRLKAGLGLAGVIEIGSEVSEMSGFTWRSSPVVVASVSVSDRRGDEFLWINVVQRGNLHGDIITADFFNVSTGERPHAAASTEQMVHAFSTELVVAGCVLPCE